MEKSKIETYLGFCVRARKIAFGVEEAEKQRKGVFLLIHDKTLGESSAKIMRKAQQTLACPMLISDEDVLGERLHRFGVKAVAIKDKNLAAAILAAIESEPQFKLYSGGNN